MPKVSEIFPLLALFPSQFVAALALCVLATRPHKNNGLKPTAMNIDKLRCGGEECINPFFFNSP